jgi:hypothetical protein
MSGFRTPKAEGSSTLHTSASATPEKDSTTFAAPRGARVPLPIAIIAYFDRWQIWVKKPVVGAELRWLKRHGLVHVANRRARFNGGYSQRLQFKQPDEAILRWLAAREDALVNAIEIAIDYVFATAAERDDAHEFFDRHLVRRWHNASQIIWHYRSKRPGAKGVEESLLGTRYDGQRSARNRIAFYRNECSRVTGELDVLHFEWRAKGVQAVRAAGIHSPVDLLNFDHRAFWQRRLLLHDIDEEVLGRLFRNHREQTRRRTEQQQGSKSDRRTGHILCSAFSTVQETIDNLRQRVRIHRALIPVPIEPWLPPST